MGRREKHASIPDIIISLTWKSHPINHINKILFVKTKCINIILIYIQRNINCIKICLMPLYSQTSATQSRGSLFQPARLRCCNAIIKGPASTREYLLPESCKHSSFVLKYISSPALQFGMESGFHCGHFLVATPAYKVSYKTPKISSADLE